MQPARAKTLFYYVDQFPWNMLPLNLNFVDSVLILAFLKEFWSQIAEHQFNTTQLVCAL